MTKKCPKCGKPLNADGACELDGNELHEQGVWAWDEEMGVWLNKDWEKVPVDSK